jgi:hypothetical protein
MSARRTNSSQANNSESATLMKKLERERYLGIGSRALPGDEMHKRG